MKKVSNIILTLLVTVLSLSFMTSCKKIDKAGKEPKTVEEQTMQPSTVLDEKSLLLNSYFGDFRKGKRENIAGERTLNVWQSHIEYSNTLPPVMRDVMLEGVQKVNVEYDEIWTWEDEEGLTPAEKRKFKGQNNICRLYWKQDKIQAATVEKYYIGNPYTGQKFRKPSHKIVNVYDRNFILKKIM